MALTFTDDQVRTVSGEVLSIPALITTLTAQKVQATQGKADTLTKDEGNQAFYDFYKNTAISYHDELKNINGLARAPYLDSVLDDSAQQKAGNLHYPASPIWTAMLPKVIDANNGLPTTPFSPYENDQLTKVFDLIDLLKNGFTDGALDDTLTTAYVIGQDIEVDTGGFVVGQRIVIDDSNVSLLAEVVAVNPPSTTGAEDLEITVLSDPNVVLGIGARVRNFHPGFTDAEREGTSTPYAPEVLQFWSDELDSEVQDWENSLDGQLAALGTLDPGGVENTDRDDAITDVNAAKTAIDTWQTAPDTGVGIGRFGDTALAPLESKITDRQSEAPARAAAILGFVGSVSQTPDGAYSGTGHYYSLFKWVDFRISKAGGTLFAFYNFDLVLKFIDNQILTATNKKAEFDATLLVLKLAEDADGTNFVTLEDVTGLSISDAVKIVDDDVLTPVFSGTIVGIGGLIVELDGPVSGFLVEKRARLVKSL